MNLRCVIYTFLLITPIRTASTCCSAFNDSLFSLPANLLLLFILSICFCFRSHSVGARSVALKEQSPAAGQHQSKSELFSKVLEVLSYGFIPQYAAYVTQLYWRILPIQHHNAIKIRKILNDTEHKNNDEGKREVPGASPKKSLVARGPREARPARTASASPALTRSSCKGKAGVSGGPRRNDGPARGTNGLPCRTYAKGTIFWNDTSEPPDRIPNG